ncbi:PepSY domain-containing protein [uncultured Ottowia sp.]|uniref:PepSY domain-containing protein n=1 Tax=uncultured Ottowia sp. TaxID=543067 RepID=UPI00338E45F8
MYDRVEAAGYVNIREIELEKYGHYKVKARNAQGGRVKLHVNAQTGEIERNRFDD